MDLEQVKTVIQGSDVQLLTRTVGDLVAHAFAGKSQAIIDGVGEAVAGRTGQLEGLVVDALAGRSPILQGTALAVIEQAKPIVQGAWEDLRTFGLLIAEDMVAAHVAANQDWIDELGAQMRALAERTRVRVDSGRWNLLETICHVIFRAAISALGMLPKPV